MTASGGAELEKQISIELVERIRRGDVAAESQLCERYYRRLLYFIGRRTGGDPELARDICQQTFLTALENLRSGKLQNSASLAAYLHGIAVYDVMNDTKRTRRRATHADTEAIERAADTEPSAFEKISSDQAKTALQKALAALSPTDRRILLRLYLNDEDRKSICTSEGYSAAQLNNIVWRAKERLKRHLLEDAGGETGQLERIRSLR